MAEIFKSDRSVAEAEAQSLKSGIIATACAIPIGRTNLEVMNNLLTLCGEISVCNNSYIEIVNNHSDSILTIQDENENTDSNLAGKIGIH